MDNRIAKIPEAIIQEVEIHERWKRILVETNCGRINKNSTIFMVRFLEPNNNSYTVFLWQGITHEYRSQGPNLGNLRDIWRYQKIQKSKYLGEILTLNVNEKAVLDERARKIEIIFTWYYISIYLKIKIFFIPSKIQALQ